MLRHTELVWRLCFSAMSLNQEQINQLAVRLIELQCNSTDLLPARDEADRFIRLALHTVFPQIDGCNVICTMPVQKRRIAEAVPVVRKAADEFLRTRHRP